MPWTADDAKKFKKGLTKKQAQQWAKIANSVLDQCLKNGGKQKSCESKAIKVANSKVDNNENCKEVNGVKKNMQVPKNAMYFVENGNISLSDDEEKQHFAIEAYSGKIIKGHYFWGDLAIDVSGIEFNSKRIPILEDHEWDKKLGVSNSLPNTEGNKVSFEKVKLLSNPRALEFKQNLDDGFPFQASISIRPSKVEELEEGAKAEVNGYTMKGPGRIIRQSIFREASACVFGADHRTSVTAFSDDDNEEVEVEVLSLSDKNNKKPKTKNNGGKSMLDFTAIKDDHPDLVEQINAALKEKDDAITSLTTERDDLKKQVTDLTAERDDLKQKSEDLSETKTEYEKRIAALERSEQLRNERDLKQKADSIVDQKLSASDVPGRLYKRIKKQIDHNAFIDDKDVFDESSFSEHVDTEINSWIEDLKDDSTSTSILGLSGGNTDNNDFSSDSDKLADHLVSLAGGVDDKK